MSTNIVDSFRWFVEHTGQGLTDELNQKLDLFRANFKGLLESALPSKTFSAKWRGNPIKATRARSSSTKQAFQKQAWLCGEQRGQKQPAVSISEFLFAEKGDKTKPCLRISVEIRIAPGKYSRRQNANEQKFFDARKNYDKMLDRPLKNGLLFFYGSDFHDHLDENLRTSFLSDKGQTSHIEIVKRIDLNQAGLSDEVLEKQVKEAVNELLPYYALATGQADQLGPKNADGENKTQQAALVSNDLKEHNQSEEDPGPNGKKIIFPMNIILFGPPGTGKTYNSIAFAEGIIKKDQTLLDSLKAGDTIGNYSELKKDFNNNLVEYDKEGKVQSGHICFTTFHQSYSYEDFIEGIFPDTENATGEIRYVLRPGVFKSLCDFAKDKPNENFVIIIDEINRGNISKIFGDLISLVEEGRRLGEENELQATLPYSKEKWGVPNNVYIIGTMNTADRSIERLDTALRRRFSFFEMMPNPELLSGYHKCMMDGGKFEELPLDEILKAMNDRISYIYDRDHQTGHSYLLDVIHKSYLGGDTYHFSDLAEAFQREIIPLLQEYFYGNYGKIRFVLGESGDESDPHDFIKIKSKSDYSSFTTLDDEEDDSYEYEVNKEAFNDFEAYKHILNTGKTN